MPTLVEQRFLFSAKAPVYLAETQFEGGFGGEGRMLGIILALVLCVAIPFLVINRLFPSLVKHAPKQRNYHGVEVLGGLGIVWFVWLACIWMGSVAVDVLGGVQPTWMEAVLVALPLLAGTCAFGLFDDWAGSKHSQGFKGHFRAMRHGELTTGMLKVGGIGLLSLFTAIAIQDFSEPLAVLRIVAATLTMALFANLMNLFDLRPLRVTKVYIVCLLATAIALALSHRIILEWTGALGFAIACIGPVIATWRLDNREIAMLGDAGANTMGALLGYLLSIALPIWLLIPVAALLMAMNLLSERVSFTKVITSVPVLRHADHLFRPRDLLAKDRLGDTLAEKDIPDISED